MAISEAQVELNGAISKALENNVRSILQPYLQTINETPDLLSLLYDVNLLPEQCGSVNAAVAVSAICEAYRMGQASASCEIE
jgi:hypothetical protein